ncbi:hypothetical protein BLOT_008803 [Blomia tropicalis]|nr:hypothetical protein BLOT_008803 [Blomia tropicalis]
MHTAEQLSDLLDFDSFRYGYRIDSSLQKNPRFAGCTVDFDDGRVPSFALFVRSSFSVITVSVELDET